MALNDNCELCMNYEYDEEYECYNCIIELDEDETRLFMLGQFKQCPYFRMGDEYTIVRGQN